MLFCLGILLKNKNTELVFKERVVAVVAREREREGGKEREREREREGGIEGGREGESCVSRSYILVLRLPDGKLRCLGRYISRPKPLAEMVPDSNRKYQVGPLLF